MPAVTRTTDHNLATICPSTPTTARRWQKCLKHQSQERNVRCVRAATGGGFPMITRRNFAAIAGAGSLGTVMGAAVTPSAAQQAGETTFERIMRTKKLRIGAV